MVGLDDIGKLGAADENCKCALEKDRFDSDQDRGLPTRPFYRATGDRWLPHKPREALLRSISP